MLNGRARTAAARPVFACATTLSCGVLEKMRAVQYTMLHRGTCACKRAVCVCRPEALVVRASLYGVTLTVPHCDNAEYDSSQRCKTSEYTDHSRYCVLL
jgi:hypothetical protein